MHLEELINQNYANMNENDRHIWSFIASNRKACEHLSIEALAQKCNVSRTTVLRFTKRLGLKGYAEFKVMLRMDNVKSNNQEQGLELVYQMYASYMEEMKEKDFTNIITLISNAKNAYVYGTGSIQNNVALEIKRSFLTVKKLFFNITSVNETNIFSDVIDEDDIMIMISFSGENPQVLEFTRKLKARHVPIISITATKDNTLSHLADEALYVEVPSVENSFGARYQGLVNYFTLVDFIIVKYIDFHNNKGDYV